MALLGDGLKRKHQKLLEFMTFELYVCATSQVLLGSYNTVSNHQVYSRFYLSCY